MNMTTTSVKIKVIITFAHQSFIAKHFKNRDRKASPIKIGFHLCFTNSVNSVIHTFWDMVKDVIYHIAS